MKSTKIKSLLGVISMACLCFWFANCEGGGGGGDEGRGGSGHSAGDTVLYSAAGTSFTMVFVPGGKTVPLWYNESKTVMVEHAYYIGETEVIYSLWKAVYDWATDPARGTKRYYFANAGIKGYGTPGLTSRHPVTTINWRDAMVFCNALTEWYNGNNMEGDNFTCVYYVDADYMTSLRDSRDGSYGSSLNDAPGGMDAPYILADASGNLDMTKCAATGFRLPGIAEWELAARWRKDATNSVSGFTNPYYTKGDSASGATGNYLDEAATGDVAWYDDNSGNITHEVKGKSPNALGIYDLSGNVKEWCFDVTVTVPAWRFMHGGSAFHPKENLKIGDVQYGAPFEETFYIGFRIARSAN